VLNANSQEIYNSVRTQNSMCAHRQAMKKFGKQRYFPKPRNDRDWDVLYRANKTLVPTISKLTLHWSKKGKGQTGIRYFKYHNIQPLQFWNKNLQVEFKKTLEPITPKIIVELSSGRSMEIPVSGLNQEDILERVVRTDPSGQIITKGLHHLITVDNY